jgi:hypothetical protein
MATILALPDFHAPFEHQDAVSFLAAVKAKYRPDIVVCLGDEGDFHGLSDWDHDPDGHSAGQEYREMLKHLKPLYALFPQALVCTSNHTARPFRKAFKHGIPKAFLRSYSDFMHAPKGWVWANSWEVDGVVFEHGEGFSGREGAIKSALANMQSTVIGHIHSFAGVQFSANAKHLIFGMNAGCLIDHKAYAFAYGAKIKQKPILGCGIIKDGVPTFVPMLLNSAGRWIKKI